MRVWWVVFLLAGCFGSDTGEQPAPEPDPLPDPVASDPGDLPTPQGPRIPPAGTDPWTVTTLHSAILPGGTGVSLVGGRCAVDSPETISFPAVAGTPYWAALRVGHSQTWSSVGPMTAIWSSETSHTGDAATDDAAVFGAIEGEGQSCAASASRAELVRSAIIENALPIDVDGRTLTVVDPIAHQRGSGPFFRDDGSWIWITYTEVPLTSIDVYAENSQTIVVQGGPANGIGVSAYADWKDGIWWVEPTITELDAPGGVVDMDAEGDLAFSVAEPLDLVRIGDTDDDGGSGAEIILSGITAKRAELESSIGEGVIVTNSTIDWISDDHALEIIDSVIGTIDQIGPVKMDRMVATGDITYTTGIGGSMQPEASLEITRSSDAGGATGSPLSFVEGPDIGYDFQIEHRGDEPTFDMDVEIIASDQNTVRAQTPDFGNKTIQVTMKAVYRGTFTGIEPFYDGRFL